mmetsp:Transcript_18702/g.29157  ORF Transcript_18702/g.29157 Transcript_18702/m.29157 type:complete len:134 (+) Transcript_18702:197-598(+)
MSSFDLERQGEAKQDVCAACSAEIHPGSGQPVVYAMDQKFCSEGCRCVWFFKQEQDGVCCSPESDVDMMKHYMVGKKSCEAPSQSVSTFLLEHHTLFLPQTQPAGPCAASSLTDVPILAALGCCGLVWRLLRS